ncbi:neuronal acetylcholine receptor subunit alpha-7 [Lingula anatina]|uniref:Neuronal acetylcholine receptor subunit alpha-7 n=1 Tax=Lingula anatina TaxID=7574 RepID=A0A1S3J6K9_LINAN|nr:neuronal acetylcholine receptor subunit alpha-7 [Lingula anatina]|eukprot:XP_013405943.1 neuronal acetylcholine receptor subunit alpha-7 [Lingula anatina]
MFLGIVLVADVFLHMLTFESLFHGCSGVRDVFNQSAEYSLKEDLLAGYNRDVRPKINASEALDIDVRINPKSIVNLEVQEQVLTLSVVLEVYWYDEFLTWDSKNYDGIKYTSFSGSSIWLPELMLTSSPDDVAKINFPLSNYHVIVHENGWASYVLHTHFSTTCIFNVVMYPLDTQVCEFDVRPRISLPSLVKIKNLEVDNSHYANSSEWEMGETSWNIYGFEETDTNTSAFDSKDGMNMTFIVNDGKAVIKFRWKRMAGYHFVTIIVPTAIIAASTVMCFWLPPDGGERVSVGLTVLLSLMVFQELVANYVPVSSTNMPLIIVYICILTICTKVSLVSSIIVINIQNRSQLGQRVPRWARQFIFNFLAYILCMRIPDHVRRDLKKRRLSKNRVNSQASTPSHGVREVPKSGNSPGCSRKIQGNCETETVAANDESNLLETEWILAAKVTDSALFWNYIILQGSAIFLVIGTPLIYKDSPISSFID